MEKIIKKALLSGTINTKTHILLAYADDIDIVGRAKRDLTGVFAKIVKESSKMGLVVNENKTKIMLAIVKEKPLRKKDEQEIVIVR